MTRRFHRPWLLAALWATVLTGNAFAAENIDITGVSDATPVAGDTIQVSVNGQLLADGDAWTSTGLALFDAGNNPVVSSIVCVNQPDPNHTAPPAATFIEVIDYTIPADLPGGTYNVVATGYDAGENCDGSTFDGTLQDSFEITVTALSDLALSLPFGSPTMTVAGDPAGLQVIIGLDKTGGEPEAAIIDFTGSTLPPGVTITGATGAEVQSFLGGVVVTQNLSPGASISFALNLAVAPSAADGAVIQLVGVASNDASTDPDPGNNTLAVPDITVERVVDIVMTITENNADPIVAGQGGTDYTYKIENLGPSDASGVMGQLAIVTTGTFVADPACAYDDPFFQAATGEWPVGNLAAGASQTLGETCGAGAASTDGANRAATLSLPFLNETDSDPANNSATADTTVERVSDLSLTKVLSSASPMVAGTQATFTIEVHNAGPSDADNVVVTDTLLPIMTYASDTAPGGCTGGPDQPACSLGTVAAGSSASFDLVVDIAPDADGPFAANGVGVASDSTDDNPGNDTSLLLDIPLVREYDLALAVVATPDPVIAGSGDPNLTYTFTLSRSGPSDVSGVIVTLAAPNLPAGVSLAGGGSSVGILDLNAGTWTIPDDAVEAADNGTVGTMVLYVTVDAMAAACTDCISVNGTVSAASGLDTDTGNNTAVDPTSIQAAPVIPTTEAIPTLDRFGMALLVLLMLGAGFIGRRRFV